MNTQNFQQTGGFPLTTNTLSFAQASWLLMQEFGEIAGDLTIIRGCEVNGLNVLPGIMFINGELLPFEGGTLGTRVIIQEERIQKQFEDGVNRPVEIIRTAKFGNGSTFYEWDDFVRITPIKELQKALIPIGLISMWAGDIAEIPAGWALCDGSDGTPDLSNKFVRGVNHLAPNMGEVAGSDTVTPSGIVQDTHLSIHVENTGWGTSGGAIGTVPSGRLIVGSGQPEISESLESLRAAGNGKTITATHSHGFAGSAQDNRPRYYALAFIQFKG